MITNISSLNPSSILALAEGSQDRMWWRTDIQDTGGKANSTSTTAYNYSSVGDVRDDGRVRRGRVDVLYVCNNETEDEVGEEIGDNLRS